MNNNSINVQYFANNDIAAIKIVGKRHRWKTHITGLENFTGPCDDKGAAQRPIMMARSAMVKQLGEL